MGAVSNFQRQACYENRANDMVGFMMPKSNGGQTGIWGLGIQLLLNWLHDEVSNKGS